MVKARPSLGRRKIEIKRIQNKVARQVSFSKRRTSAVKKANELSILCGAEIAAVVFSPAGKVFSFGHPSVDTVMNRYLNTSCQDGAIVASGSQGNARTSPTPRGLQLQIEEINKLVEVEKLKAKQLGDGIGSNCDERVLRWFRYGAEALGLNELEDIQKELVALKSAVRGHISG